MEKPKLPSESTPVSPPHAQSPSHYDLPTTASLLARPQTSSNEGQEGTWREQGRRIVLFLALEWLLILVLELRVSDRTNICGVNFD